MSVSSATSEDKPDKSSPRRIYSSEKVVSCIGKTGQALKEGADPSDNVDGPEEKHSCVEVQISVVQRWI
jgi:hypothetical protein